MRCMSKQSRHIQNTSILNISNFGRVITDSDLWLLLHRSERPFTLDTESEIFSHEETSSRISHSAPSHRQDFRRHPIEPPLVNRDRDRYVVDVPKSDRYPSPSQSRQLVSQRLSRLASSADDGDEDTFVIAPDGFIPNSVVVAMFKDLREEGTEEADTWKPPQLTAEQLAELESRKKVNTGEKFSLLLDEPLS